MFSQQKSQLIAFADHVIYFSLFAQNGRIGSRSNEYIRSRRKWNGKTVTQRHHLWTHHWTLSPAMILRHVTTAKVGRNRRYYIKDIQYPEVPKVLTTRKPQTGKFVLFISLLISRYLRTTSLEVWGYDTDWGHCVPLNRDDNKEIATMGRNPAVLDERKSA